MKIQIEKFDHSCLLVRAEKKSFLIDPGEYSRQKIEKNLSKLKDLDYILITHEHPDHFSQENVKKLVSFSPNVKVIAPSSVINKINSNKTLLVSGGDENVSVEFSDHEELLDMEIPQNISFTVLNKLTHPGDSLKFKENADVLALPVQAPWGSMTSAAKTALEKNPKIIVPIHDWHWKDEAKKALYQKMEDFFSSADIKFINLYKKDNIAINI